MLEFEAPCHARLQARTLRLLARLPAMHGDPIRIRFVRDLSPRGPVHAGAFVRERRILFETSLERRRGEFARIFVHELFHFVWVRLGNSLRRSYEDLLAREMVAGAPGELGWSAEWRKAALTRRDRLWRTRRWREYVCESFCDAAAWRFAGLRRHGEFTLTDRFRRRRRQWFDGSGVAGAISV